MKLPSLYKYKAKKRTGQSFAYTLYEAVDQTNGNEVLLRVLHKEIAKNETYVVRFLSNARMLTLLENPNICTVYDLGNDQDNYFLATEPLKGWDTLDSLISETFSLSIPDFLEIFIQVGKTLRQAHLHGMTHGLLNPKNIYLNSDRLVKIDDFGFSWAIHEVFKQHDKHSAYMAQYISPELYAPKSKIDGRVDMYSMGAMMFHLLTGSPLYDGRSVAELKTQHLRADLPVDKLYELELPEALQNTVIRALDLKSDSRFLNLKEFVDYLEDLKGDFAGETETEEKVAIEDATPVYAPKYVEQYFVEDEEVEVRRPNFFTSRAFVFTILALIVAVSAFMVGKDKLQLGSSAGYSNLDSIADIAADTMTEVAGITQEPADVDPADLVAVMEAEFRNKKSSELAVSGDQDSKIKISGPSDLLQNHLSATNGTDIRRSAPVKKSSVSSKNKSKKKTGLAKADTKKKSKAKAKTSSKKSVAKSSKTKTSKPIVKKAVSKKSNAKKKALAKNSKATRKTAIKFVVTSDKDPKGAAVFVNNKFKGKTDSKGTLQIKDLEVGKSYTAKISRNGYKTITKKFTASTKTSVIDLAMKPKRDIFGTLVLDAAPAADSIYIDGKLYKGKMPLNLTLPWGEHRVRYVNVKLKKSWEEVVHLKVGQILRVKHDFAQAEYGKIAVSLRNAANFGFGFVFVDGKLWEGTPNTTPLELKLPTGSHTVEVRRDGFSSIPRDIIVVIKKDKTKFVAFTFSKNEPRKTD